MSARARPHARMAALAAFAALAALVPGAAAQDAPRKQEIIFDEIPAHAVGDAPFDIAAKATSGLALTLEVVSGPAVIEGKKLKLTGTPGLVVIRASQAGNAAFGPARDAERAFTVRPSPAAPAILSGPRGQEAEIGDAVALSVEATGEPTPTFQWRRNGVPITGATGRDFSIASAALSDTGAYDVVASNPSGDATSAPARVDVVKRRQSISFQGAANGTAGQPLSLSATASSGLPVRFDVMSGSAVLNGGTLTSQGGAVVVQASQPGDSVYEPAMPVTQTFLFSGSPNQHQP